jgi:hypothetical protein
MQTLSQKGSFMGRLKIISITVVFGTKCYLVFSLSHEIVNHSFILKLFGASQAIVFAEDADEQTFCFGFSSGLARAA